MCYKTDTHEQENACLTMRILILVTLLAIISVDSKANETSNIVIGKLSEKLILDKIQSFEQKIAALENENKAMKEAFTKQESIIDFQVEKVDLISGNVENFLNVADKSVEHTTSLFTWGSFIVVLVLAIATIAFQLWTSGKRKEDIDRLSDEIGENLVKGVLHGGIKKRFLKALFETPQFMQSLNKTVESVVHSGEVEKEWGSAGRSEDVLDPQVMKKKSEA